MEDKRPGQASVQYDDVRGEVAGDISDRLHTLQHVAQELGFNGSGMVVGISIYGGDEGIHDPNLVFVTFQAVDSMEALKEKLLASGGVLEVTEYHKVHVPIGDFVRCFKRLKVSLFQWRMEARSIEVVESIEIDDAKD